MPILSSSDGFHDNSPELEPWESCLQVLQSTYVMVLVIDGKYGEKFEWKNFATVIDGRKVSPTHAEYIFAHKTKMRMLVFIRKEILTYYQTYRTAIKKANGDKAQAKENLEKVLPNHIAFETLEFAEEVKTSRPIPWIKPFENVTDIKQEIQKKMLNELAELFLFKNKHLESVIRAFSSGLDDLPEEKRKETLQKIGATKELIDEIEIQTKLIQDLKKEKEQIQNQFKEKSEALEAAKKKNSTEKAQLQQQIKTLTEELNNINTRISTHEFNNSNYLITGSPIPYSNSGLGAASGFFFGGSGAELAIKTNPLNDAGGLNSGTLSVSSFTKKCDKCHRDIASPTAFTYPSPQKCPTCKRELCTQCFNGNYIGLFHECEECRNKKAVLS